MGLIPWLFSREHSTWIVVPPPWISLQKAAGQLGEREEVGQRRHVLAGEQESCCKAPSVCKSAQICPLQQHDNHNTDYPPVSKVTRRENGPLDRGALRY